MIPLEALKLALSKEEEAIELYQRLAADFPVAKDTFLFLTGEEQKHKLLLEKRIQELTK